MKNKNLKPCYVIEIITPKRIQLDGLWFGPVRPKRVIVFIHGLASSVFKTSIAEKWVNKDTAVITFNNRGHDTLTIVKKMGKSEKDYKRIPAGKVHEVFTDCADDIQGVVNFIHRQGIREIYLAGHSTGCQKSVYYLSRKNNQKFIKGLILLAPMSDYSGVLSFGEKSQWVKAVKVARTLVKQGKKHELLPNDIWPSLLDAQRFLSLYTPDSIEEIFSYVQPKKNPRLLKSIKIPILTLLREEDEFKDRPMTGIAEWFKKHTTSQKSKVAIIPGALHSFPGCEDKVAQEIKNWIIK